MVNGQKIRNFVFFYHVGRVFNVTGVSNFIELSWIGSIFT